MRARWGCGMNPGYIYVLSNPSMPGLVKIGFTRRPVRERAFELYKEITGIPTPFNIEFEIFTKYPEEDEKHIHRRLVNYRVSEYREFFRIDVQTSIVEVISVVIVSMGGDTHSVTTHDIAELHCAAYESSQQVGCSVDAVISAYWHLDPQSIRDALVKRNVAQGWDIDKWQLSANELYQLDCDDHPSRNICDGHTSLGGWSRS